MESHHLKCRLCLSSSDRKVMMNEQVLQKIVELIQLEIIQTRNYSNFVCEACNSSLETFSSFRSEIIEKQKSLGLYLCRMILPGKVRVKKKDFPALQIKEETPLDLHPLYLPLEEPEREPVFFIGSETVIKNETLADLNLLDFEWVAPSLKLFVQAETQTDVSPEAYRKPSEKRSFSGNDLDGPSLKQAAHVATRVAEVPIDVDEDATDNPDFSIDIIPETEAAATMNRTISEALKNGSDTYKGFEYLKSFFDNSTIFTGNFDLLPDEKGFLYFKCPFCLPAVYSKGVKKLKGSFVKGKIKLRQGNDISNIKAHIKKSHNAIMKTHT